MASPNITATCGPGALSDPARNPPADRRRVVHLSAVRLRPRPAGRNRGHHSLPLHARVRGLTDRSTIGCSRTCRCLLRPHQYEFARPNFTYTVCSRKRSPTAACERGPRARLGRSAHAHPLGPALLQGGFPPEGLRNFLDMVSLGGKGTSAAEIEMLEHEVRDVLNRRALRRFAVLRPLRLVIENCSRGAGRGGWRPPTTRRIPRPGQLLWVPFAREPLDRTRRLYGGPAKQVLPPRPRPRSAFALRLLRDLHRRRIKDASGEIVELRCAYDPETRGGDAPDGRRAEGDAALALVRARRARPSAYV